MRIAVTGGSGRVGSAVCRELVSRGHEVFNLDIKAPAEPVGRFFHAPLGQREVVQPLLEQVEAVAHLGEIPNIHSGPSPLDVYTHNTQVGGVVLQTAADLKLKRLVYTSSAQVYGMWSGTCASPRQLPFDETHPIAPHNAYAVGKVANEIYARMVSERQGLSVAIFRLPWVHPGDTLEPLDVTLREWPRATDGFATYVNVGDIARAYALALERPRAGCEVYHFSAGEILSLHPLRERLRRHHPDFPPLPIDWADFRSPLITAKARDHLGWEPQWNWLDLYRRKHGEPAVI